MGITEACQNDCNGMLVIINNAAGAADTPEAQ
jgi:hypothetical protein